MLVVGLTGGIASGKSTVTAMFAALGARTLSADDDAKAVLRTGSPVLNEVRATFPSVAAEDGGLDRPALAAIIFASLDARRCLEAIMHPAIEMRMQEAIRSARNCEPGSVLVYEVPLLFENDLAPLFDRTVAVFASQNNQMRRLQDRESAAGRHPLRAAEVAERLDAQLPSATKAERADYVIHNDSTLDATREQVASLWAEISVSTELRQPSHA